MSAAGLVFDIQRFSVHDGPGIRTLVFLKGCPLRCAWCCNPESQAAAPELLIDAGACLGCRRCLAACPQGAVREAGGRLVFHRDGCVACGRCAADCYAGARTLSGRRLPVEAVVAEVLRDAPFYRRSGGGVTLGGGEPLAQPGFAAALLQACRAMGLHTAIETCGHASEESLRGVLPWVDLVLFDVKHAEAGPHLAGTGGSLELVMANLRRTVDAGTAVTVRTPVIPGFNDSAEVVGAIAGRVRALGVEEMHLAPYHPLGRRKWALLGRAVPPGQAEPPAADRLERLREVAAAAGLRVALLP